MSCLCLLQRTSPEGGIHLNCHYCHNLFSGKPEILDWQVRTFPQGDVEVEANPSEDRKAPFSPYSKQSCCASALNALAADMPGDRTPSAALLMFSRMSEGQEETTAANPRARRAGDLAQPRSLALASARSAGTSCQSG